MVRIGSAARRVPEDGGGSLEPRPRCAPVTARSTGSVLVPLVAAGFGRSSIDVEVARDACPERVLEAGREDRIRTL